MLDLVLLGSGVPVGLLAWRLVSTRPDVSFMVVESSGALASQKTIWFRGTDITRAQLEWLWVLCAKSFPSHDMERAGGEPRRIGGAFHAIDGEDFHGKLLELLGDRVRLRAPVREVTATQVTLDSGEVLHAKVVIDGRDDEGTPAWPHTFQELFLTQTHAGLEVPLMGLRSMPRRALPIDGDAPRSPWPTIGARAGLFHAVTGELLPMATDVASVVPTLKLEEIAPWLRDYAQQHWEAMGFYRRLNRGDRTKLFEVVHSLSDDAIARFYAGTSTTLDKLTLRAKLAFAR